MQHALLPAFKKCPLQVGVHWAIIAINIFVARSIGLGRNPADRFFVNRIHAGILPNETPNCKRKQRKMITFYDPLPFAKLLRRLAKKGVKLFMQVDGEMVLLRAGKKKRCAS
jgi:hypothetical protein